MGRLVGEHLAKCFTNSDVHRTGDVWVKLLLGTNCSPNSNHNCLNNSSRPSTSAQAPIRIILEILNCGWLQFSLPIVFISTGHAGRVNKLLWVYLSRISYVDIYGKGLCRHNQWKGRPHTHIQYLDGLYQECKCRPLTFFIYTCSLWHKCDTRSQSPKMKYMHIICRFQSHVTKSHMVS